MSDKPMSLTGEITGRWAVCSRGVLGKITGRKVLPWGESWVGFSLAGEPWASRAPTVTDPATSNALDQQRARLSALESELNNLRRIQHANEPELEMPSPERMAALRARARIERTSALPCSNVSDWDGEDGG